MRVYKMENNDSGRRNRSRDLGRPWESRVTRGWWSLLVDNSSEAGEAVLQRVGGNSDQHSAWHRSEPCETLVQIKQGADSFSYFKA